MCRSFKGIINKPCVQMTFKSLLFLLHLIALFQKFYFSWMNLCNGSLGRPPDRDVCGRSSSKIFRRLICSTLDVTASFVFLYSLTEASVSRLLKTMLAITMSVLLTTMTSLQLLTLSPKTAASLEVQKAGGEEDDGSEKSVSKLFRGWEFC